MWIVRWILIFILIVILLYFGAANIDQKVTITFWNYQVVDLLLVMALLVAFLLGAFVWFIVAAFQIVQIKNEMRGVRRENSRLKKELADLRNLSIEEESPNPETEESGNS